MKPQRRDILDYQNMLLNGDSGLSANVLESSGGDEVKQWCVVTECFENQPEISGLEGGRGKEPMCVLG